MTVTLAHNNSQHSSSQEHEAHFVKVNYKRNPFGSHNCVVYRLHCIWTREMIVCGTQACIHIFIYPHVFMGLYLSKWLCTFCVYTFVCMYTTDVSPRAKTITSCLHKHPDWRHFLLPNWPWNIPSRQPRTFRALQKETGYKFSPERNPKLLPHCSVKPSADLIGALWMWRYSCCFALWWKQRLCIELKVCRSEQFFDIALLSYLVKPHMINTHLTTRSDALCHVSSKLWSFGASFWWFERQTFMLECFMLHKTEMNLNDALDDAAICGVMWKPTKWRGGAGKKRKDRENHSNSIKKHQQPLCCIQHIVVFRFSNKLMD